MGPLKGSVDISELACKVVYVVSSKRIRKYHHRMRSF